MLLPISIAKKDHFKILIFLKNPIPSDREDLRRWDGDIFVGFHPGLSNGEFDVGWCFASPVGRGGFPDEWIEGWLPIPEHDYNIGCE